MPAISQLPPATSVTGADLLAVVQSSITKKATISEVVTLITTGLGLGTAAFIDTPITPANGGTGVIDPAAHTLPVAQGASNFAFLGPLVNGQLLIGSTGANPAPATITAGTNISISNTAGGITISSTGLGSFSWTHVTTTSQQMLTNNGYVADNASLVTLTLPTTSAFGDEIDIIGRGAGGWHIAQNANQKIVMGTAVTTTGVGGSITSSQVTDSFYMICTVANTEWTIASAPQSAGLTIV